MQKKLRFLIAHVVPPSMRKEDADKELAEILSLVDTYGGATVAKIIQRRANPDSHTYVGKGKAQEIVGFVKSEKIDVIVINDVTKPGQLFNLQKQAWEHNPDIEVWDRVDLIINIFDLHAHTAEAKLQIKIAKMRHMGPRIYGLGGVLSKQGTGVGSKGLGETNTELMKRHWREQVKKVRDELDKLSSHREHQMQRRRSLGYKTISIVGYTNAGKSTLFNLITGKKKKAADVLFATLDSNVGKIYLQSIQKEILISDTIGFIQNLPTKLIEAFKSTLMESVNADMLIHVVDASDKNMFDKLTVVQNILEELGIKTKKTIYVFNKIDHLEKQQMLGLLESYKKYNPQLLSATTELGLPELMETIEKEIV
jgi:GTP-binding protein HflX